MFINVIGPSNHFKLEIFEFSNFSKTALGQITPRKMVVYFLKKLFLMRKQQCLRHITLRKTLRVNAP